MEWIVEAETMSELIDGRFTATTKPLIRCKDCKHHRYDNDGIPYCLRLDYGYGWGDDDFCSRVKKKKRECGNEGRWE